MNKEDFKILLGSYGADLMRWPQNLRNVAAPMFLQYPGLVEDAATIDALLDDYQVENISPAFLEEVIAQAQVAHNDNISLWKRIAMLSACAIVGFWCGNISLHAQTHYVAKENSMKSMLLGPIKLSEVML